MTTVTVGATKAKTAPSSASSFGLPRQEVPKSEIPKFDLPNMEMPEAVRALADKGVTHAKDTVEKAKAAAEQATDLLKSTYATAAKGATDYNLKVLEIVRANTSAAFEHAHELLGVKSLPEFVELSTAHAHKQFEAMTAQTQELTELAQKVTTEVAEPLKTGMTKAFTNGA
jgi:phasin